MQHGKKGRKLHREKRQRVALLRSLARSLVLHEGITTTTAKAKEVRPFIEQLITLAKSGTVASRRIISSRLGNEILATKKIHGELAKRYEKRAGGYTRITRLSRVGKRVIDSSRIELLK